MTTVPDSRPATVVYVDADVQNRMAARESLGEDRVLSMSEGRHALAAARLYQPDVIIIGKLTDMSPEHFVALVRSERRLTTTPVVVLTDDNRADRLSKLATYIRPAQGDRFHRRLVALLAAPRRG